MDSRSTLPVKSVLDDSYRIVRVVGWGGFGSTYEAEDIKLNMRVALQECYPLEFGDRDATLGVKPKSDRHRQTFQWGRSNFLLEARTLARFEHPSIVRVTRVFEASSTPRQHHCAHRRHAGAARFRCRSPRRGREEPQAHPASSRRDPRRTSATRSTAACRAPGRTSMRLGGGLPRGHGQDAARGRPAGGRRPNAHGRAGREVTLSAAVPLRHRRLPEGAPLAAAAVGGPAASHAARRGC
jgi:hypothetical protein